MMLHGSCLCGAVRFEAPGQGGVTGCHCSQCRKTSGHFAASFDVAEADVLWHARSTLATYALPGGGTRAFCLGCGSKIWFRAADGGFSVEAGVIDGPTGLRMAGHIFVADKGDYYQIADGLPQHGGSADA